MATREGFTQWLNAYGAGWVNQNPKATLALFTDDATYMYTPFHKLMHGKDEIRRYVEKGAVGLQEDIEFDYEILAITEAYGINRWKAALTWKQTGERLRFDGIYQVFLNDDNLCYRFDEWWHSKPPLPEDNAPE
jgi:SnoaL-like domain